MSAEQKDINTSAATGDGQTSQENGAARDGWIQISKAITIMGCTKTTMARLLKEGAFEMKQHPYDRRVKLVKRKAAEDMRREIEESGTFFIRKLTPKKGKEAE